MKKYLLALFFVLSIGQANAQTTFWASSGVGAGAGTPGSDSNNCTDISTPCLTLDGALAKFRAVNGYSGANGIINLRAGDYDSKGFKMAGGLVTIPSGASDAAPFTIKSYDGNNAARIIREDRFGPITKTVAEMQSATCTSTISGETNLDCLGAPTLQECTVRGWGSGYPGSCWNGAPSSTYLYLRLNRSGGDFHGTQNMSDAIIDWYGLSESASNNVKYVVFEDLNFDGRGVAVNIMRNTVSWAHTMWGTNLKWKGGSIRNSAGSCFAQPGVGGTDNGSSDGSPYGNTYLGISWEHSAVWNGSAWVQGPRLVNNWLFEGTLADPHIIEKCGIPFNTYVVPGQSGGLTARNHPEAKFLHGWYTALGGNVCNYCELRLAAGNSAGAEAEDNVIRNSYVHSSSISGHYITGERTIIENSVFYNNGGLAGYELNMFASRQAVIRNNTFVAGPNSGNVGIFIADRSYDGNLIENNIFYGYPEPIQNSSCHDQQHTGTCFGASYPHSTIRNNLAFKSGTTLTSVTRDIVSPVLSPTVSGSILNQNPLLVNPPVDFSIQSGSPAKDAAYNNGLGSDRLGNTRPFGTAIDIGAYEYCTGGGCTAAPTTATVTVLSTNPSSGVSISWTGGTGCNLTSPQSTTFNLVCDIGSSLVFTAPSTAGGANFASWTGCTSASGTTCNVTLVSGLTITAGYGVSKALTVSATALPGSATITVSPADLSSQSNGATTFTRNYSPNTVVMLTAPGNVGSIYFLAWSGCNSTSGFGSVTCSVTLDTDKTVTATYGGNGCGVDKDNVTIGTPVSLCSQTNVRDAANGNAIGTQNIGATGTITGGPTSGGGVEWVQTDFASGVDGWTTRRNLVPTGSTPPVVTGGARIGM